jgi:hypothetical protein
LSRFILSGKGVFIRPQHEKKIAADSYSSFGSVAGKILYWKAIAREMVSSFPKS